VHETPDEISGIPRDDLLLPRGQFNLSQVLATGAVLREKQGQCLDVLLTSVIPIRWTLNTPEFGITAAMAFLAATMRPGQLSQQAMQSA
jgi:hypothetical protein